MKTVIRGGTVVNAHHAGPADVLIDGEEIAAVGRLGDLGSQERQGALAASNSLNSDSIHFLPLREPALPSGNCILSLFSGPARYAARSVSHDCSHALIRSSSLSISGTKGLPLK